MRAYKFSEHSNQLDNREIYSHIYDTPWYEGCTYPRFSDAEFERRYKLTREKMERFGVDVLLAPGGPHHWSYGGGMMWLSGHWNWHCMVEYVAVPKEGDPLQVYSMGGTHLEASRRLSYVKDMRYSRGGQFIEVIAEWLHEQGLEKSKIGIAESDWTFHEYVPINHIEQLEELCPDATIELIPDFFHELVYLKSLEEQEFVAKAGKLLVDAIYAIRDRARPGVMEFQLAASAAKAIMDGDGQLDFLIIGSTPMDNPAQLFGNPRPSWKPLEEGDIILTELAGGYHGYSAQLGVPICVGEPTERVRNFFDEIVLPGYLKMAETMKPGNTLEDVRQSGLFFREKGVQSRPLHLHGIDFVSNSPHIGVDHIRAFPYEEEIKPGACLMLEPCPITAEGDLGMFYGHTFNVVEGGAVRVTDMKDELLVAKW